MFVFLRKSVAVLLLFLAPAAVAGSYTNIDQMSGWEHCTVCAGIGGSGPVAIYEMKRYINSPSLDGAAAQFWIGGSTPYANALWWKQLTPQPEARNFQYEFWAYMVNPRAAQALEFDINQTVNGKKFIFGTECDFKDKKVWKVWDPAGSRWMPTSVGCVPFTAYSWNHFVFEFQRTADDKLFFVAVNINGQKYYFNRTYSPLPNVNAKELNVAVQLDGNYRQEDYSLWLDRIALHYW